MLAIRLSRTGKKHEPHYRIVVAERRSKRDGKTVALLGHWHPKEGKLTVNKKIYEEWIAKGARPSDSVRQLIKS